MMILELIADAVEYGKIKDIEGLVKEAIEDGVSPLEILDKSINEAFKTVNTKYDTGRVFVPEILISAKSAKKGIDALKPYLTENCANKHGKYIIGTVAGDYHDIGKNIVSLMMESVGFEVIDLGVNVPAEKFISAVWSNIDCHVVGISSLLTTTLFALKNTVAMMIKIGCKSKVKIMVGGAAVTKNIADRIDADAYTQNAAEAAVKAIELAQSMTMNYSFNVYTARRNTQREICG